MKEAGGEDVLTAAALECMKEIMVKLNGESKVKQAAATVQTDGEMEQLQPMIIHTSVHVRDLDVSLLLEPIANLKVTTNVHEMKSTSPA